MSAWIRYKKQRRLGRDEELQELLWDSGMEIDVSKDMLYYVVHSDDLKVAFMGPADDQYILGRSLRRTWVVCGETDIFVIARDESRTAEANACKLAHDICRRLKDVVGNAECVSRWG